MVKKFEDLYEESLREGEYIPPQSLRFLMGHPDSNVSVLAYFVSDFLKREWNSLAMRWYRFFLWREKKRLAAEARLVRGWNKLRHKVGFGLMRVGTWLMRKGYYIDPQVKEAEDK